MSPSRSKTSARKPAGQVALVGVVGNEHDDGVNKPATSIVYWPMLIKDWWTQPVEVHRTMNYVVRSERVGSPGFLRELQQAVWSINPNLPLANVRTLGDIHTASMAQTFTSTRPMGRA